METVDRDAHPCGIPLLVARAYRWMTAGIPGTARGWNVDETMLSRRPSTGATPEGRFTNDRIPGLTAAHPRPGAVAHRIRAVVHATRPVTGARSVHGARAVTARRADTRLLRGVATPVGRPLPATSQARAIGPEGPIRLHRRAYLVLDRTEDFRRFLARRWLVADGFDGAPGANRHTLVSPTITLVTDATRIRARLVPGGLPCAPTGPSPRR